MEQRIRIFQSALRDVKYKYGKALPATREPPSEGSHGEL